MKIHRNFAHCANLKFAYSNNNRNHQDYSQDDAGLHLSEARKNNAIYIGSKFKPCFIEIKRKIFWSNVLISIFGSTNNHKSSAYI